MLGLQVGVFVFCFVFEVCYRLLILQVFAVDWGLLCFGFEFYVIYDVLV